MPTPDLELLEKYADERDESAFAALVERYSSLVFGVCRRICGDSDGDDAAQAVFSLLARKAAQLRGHPSLAGWLHRAATNVALRQSEAIRIRQTHERGARLTPMSHSEPDENLRAELDAALQALPSRYREPLIEFHLRGRARDDIATALSSTSEAIGMRLVRGREMLAKILKRRGVIATASALSAMLAATSSPSSEVIVRTAALASEFHAHPERCPDAITNLITSAVRTRPPVLQFAVLLIAVVAATAMFLIESGKKREALSPDSKKSELKDMEVPAAPLADIVQLGSVTSSNSSAGTSMKLVLFGDTDGHHLAGMDDGERLMGTLVSAELASIPLGEFAKEMSELRKVPIVVEPECGPVVIPSISERQVPLDSLLDRICQPLALSWRLAANAIVIEPAPAKTPTVIN